MTNYAKLGEYIALKRQAEDAAPLCGEPEIK